MDAKWLLDAAKKIGVHAATPAQLGNRVLQGALESYASDVRAEDVVLLRDGTLFGSGKKGYLFTKRALYCSAKVMWLEETGTVTYKNFISLDGLDFVSEEDGVLLCRRGSLAMSVDLGRDTAEVSAVLNSVMSRAGTASPMPVPRPSEQMITQPSPGPMQDKREEDTRFQEASAAREAGDYIKCRNLLLPLAQRGHMEAQFELGSLYEEGRGFPADKAEALHWYEQAARQGYMIAQHCCAWMYRHGEGTEVNNEKAFAWYQKAAEQGHARSQFSLAILYESGQGVAVDKSKALYWYEKAAEQGHAGAQCNLGLLYDTGEGAAADKSKALYWYEEAANRGNAKAQFNLALMYNNGEGTAVDKSKAIYWYERAAEQGNAKAQFNLGVMLYNGDSTSSDPARAISLIEKSAAQGNPSAVDALSRLQGKKNAI